MKRFKGKSRVLGIDLGAIRSIALMVATVPLLLVTYCVSFLPMKSDASLRVDRIIFTSCFDLADGSQLWPAILEEKSDVFVWTGDIVYADKSIENGNVTFVKEISNISLLRKQYNELKNLPLYRQLGKTTRITGVYDDHDFGKNDGGKEYLLKAQSKNALLEFLDEPIDSPRNRQDGVYVSYDLGKKGEKIRLILLDVRYNRDMPGSTGDTLGETQWAWLKDQLQNNNADLTFLVSGIQILSNEHNREKWGNFPRARERLLNLVSKSQSPVIFITGDRHFAEISKMKVGSRDLIEVTASGMSYTLKGHKEPNRHRLGSMFTEQNYSLVAIDWTTRNVSLQIKDKDASTKLEVNTRF